jgi:8-oxo-dGTP pyrophosphatase MutT (NUDIX family)
MFQSFKKNITEGLSGALPGAKAHNLMYPTQRDSTFRFPVFDRPPVRSAVLILFYPDSGGRIRFPLIQRPTYNGAHSGQIGLPGGKSEEHDRDLVHTALREAQEEIGINPASVEVAGSLSELHIAVSNFLVTPVIGFTNRRPAFVLDPAEVEAIIETEISTLTDASCRRHGTVVTGGKYEIQTPYFEIENKVVWGATAMMLSELCMIIENGRTVAP